MPRNPAGTYELPLAPVIPAEVIEVDWANESLDDIAAALTDSLSRNGAGGMLVPLKVIDGTEVLPGISFSLETGTGVYRPAAGQMGTSILGVKQLLLTALGLELTNPPTQANHATNMQYVEDAVTGGGRIDDSVTALTTTWSSTKTDAEITAAGRIDDGATATTTTWSSTKITAEITTAGRIDDSVTTLTTTWSSTKIDAGITAAGASEINDFQTAPDTTWSSSKIVDAIHPDGGGEPTIRNYASLLKFGAIQW